MSPANNFTSGFSRLRYLGIKRFLNSYQVEYAKHTITQVSDLKEKLETLGIRKKEATIAKLDIVAIHPSIQFLIVKKAALQV